MFKIFKRFYQFIFQYKKAFIIFSLVLVVAAVLENLNPYFYKLLVDSAPSRNYPDLITILVLFIGVKISSNFMNALTFYLGDKVLIPAARDARIAVFRYIQDLDFAFHVNKNTGSLISAFKRGDGAFFDLFHDIHHNIIRTIVSLMVVLFFFSRVSTSIAWLLLAVFVGNVFLSWQLIKVNMKARKAFNKSEDLVSGIITDNLINYETVKFFAQEKREEKRLTIEFQDWFAKIWRYANSFRLMDVGVGSLANLGALAVLWIVVKRLAEGKIGAGDFVMVVSFMTGFYYQLSGILYRLRDIAKHYVDIDRYFSILDEPVLVSDPSIPAAVDKIRGEIGFEDVDFAYPDSQEMVIKDISLHINPGESVAFVGRSGVGKTTIIKLLLRFYDVGQGTITVDGIDIRKFTKSQLRSFIGIVPQEPILFNNTIGFNIGYGKENVSLEKIIKVAKLANLHDFVENLPEKYDTEVGERGIKLSGGQKQRLAIARMLLIDPQIIIFDEATSNLDSESERLIQKALWEVAKDRTVLIIAHRFSTVRKAQRIIVMDEGRIVEMGTHEDLVGKKKGLYQYLWQLQTKGELGE
ncbi:MAG TPA: ABC transporter ATP-binding protein [Candidatus Bathyarchaeia archaeon]|nr:ABC transporter ATP-binding protein [Candidatus Bathyarchaeia archaeon]